MVTKEHDPASESPPSGGDTTTGASLSLCRCSTTNVVLAGKELIQIDERYTSKTCSGCGHTQPCRSGSARMAVGTVASAWTLMRTARSTAEAVPCPAPGHTRVIPCGVRLCSPQLSTSDHVADGRLLFARLCIAASTTNPVAPAREPVAAGGWGSARPHAHPGGRRVPGVRVRRPGPGRQERQPGPDVQCRVVPAGPGAAYVGGHTWPWRARAVRHADRFQHQRLNHCGKSRRWQQCHHPPLAPRTRKTTRALTRALSP